MTESNSSSSDGSSDTSGTYTSDDSGGNDGNGSSTYNSSSGGGLTTAALASALGSSGSNTPGSNAPKLNGARETRFDPGATVPLIFGPYCRLGGQTVLMGKLQSETHKGGNVSYKINIGFVFGRVSSTSSAEVLRLIYNGKLMYKGAEAPLTVSTTAPDGVDIVPDTVYKENGKVLAQYLDIVSPNGGPDLGQFIPGGKLTVTGSAHGNNNGEHEVLSAAASTITGESRLRLRIGNNLSSAGVAESNAVLTLEQGLKQFTKKTFDEIEILDGTQATAPALCTKIVGSGNEPYWKGDVVVLLTELGLSKSGGRVLPIDAIVAERSSMTVGEVIEEIAAVALDDEGFQYTLPDPSNVDASACTDAFEGIVLADDWSPADTINQIMQVFFLLKQQRGADLVFFPRADAEEITVDVDDLAAHERLSGDAPRVLQVAPADPSEIPYMVTLRFFDKERQGQVNSVNAQRQTRTSNKVLNIDVPITMTSTDAAIRAKMLLWEQQFVNDRMVAELPFSYLRVAEGDILNITQEGAAHRMLVDTVTIGHNGVIRFEGKREPPSGWLDQDAVWEDLLDAINDAEVNVLEGIVEGYGLDIPPLTIDDVNAHGGQVLYSAGRFVHSGTNKEIPTGFNTWRSTLTDTESDYDFFCANTSFTIIGKVITSTLDSGLNDCCLDEVSEVYVELTSGEYDDGGTLLTITDDQMFGSMMHNLALIGQEIVQFRTAVDQGDNVWKLTGFIRGVRNTTAWMDSHVVGERFCVLGSYGLKRVHPGVNIPQSVEAVGDTHYWKFGPVILEPDEIGESVAETYEGYGLKPPRPYAVTAHWDKVIGTDSGFGILPLPSGSLLVSWAPTSRVPFNSAHYDQDNIDNVTLFPYPDIPAFNVQLLVSGSVVYDYGELTVKNQVALTEFSITKGFYDSDLDTTDAAQVSFAQGEWVFGVSPAALTAVGIGIGNTFTVRVIPGSAAFADGGDYTDIETTRVN